MLFECERGIILTSGTVVKAWVLNVLQGKKYIIRKNGDPSYSTFLIIIFFTIINCFKYCLPLMKLAENPKGLSEVAPDLNARDTRLLLEENCNKDRVLSRGFPFRVLITSSDVLCPS